MRFRSSRYRRKSRPQGEVELNVAAMLDMAFQLLAFFILTFKPSPIESQILMRMPDEPVTRVDSTQADPGDSPTIDVFVPELTVSLFATPTGEIETLRFGERELSDPSIDKLYSKFRGMLAELVEMGCDTVSVRAADDLRYERLMQVVDICVKQKLPNGQTLTKLSVLPLRDN